jgi:hypothetical protein
MVVIETTSQIVEVEETETGHSNSKHASVIDRLLLFHPDCSNSSTNHGFPMTTFIYEGYMRLKPLLYPCTIEFSLMCLTVGFDLSIHAEIRHSLSLVVLLDLGEHRQDIQSSHLG